MINRGTSPDARGDWRSWPPWPRWRPGSPRATPPARSTARSATWVRRAAARSAPCRVLVAYDIPLRDCSQYSAGGAQSDRRLPGMDRRTGQGPGQQPGRRDPRTRRAGHLPSDCGADTHDPDRYPQRRPDRRQSTTPVDVLEGAARRLGLPSTTPATAKWHSVGDMAARLIPGRLVARATGLLPQRVQPSSRHPTRSTSTAPGSPSASGFATEWSPPGLAGHTDWCASLRTTRPRRRAERWGCRATRCHPPTPAPWHWTRRLVRPETPVPRRPDQLDPLRRGHQPATARVRGPPHPGTYTGGRRRPGCKPAGPGASAPAPTAHTGRPAGRRRTCSWKDDRGESDGQCNRGQSRAGTVDPGGTASSIPPPVPGGRRKAHGLASNASPALTLNPNLF